jgi:ADP-ribose pyrophosphatase YjhB (NUDIX family)
MAKLGVTVAIIRDNQVVLTKREDFEVWCLPGGEMDPGESPAQTAVREAREETGLEVQLTRLVGLYAIPGWTVGDTCSALFAAEITGGEMRTDAAETIDIGLFSEDALPQDLIWWHRQRIRDALNGVGGSAVWTQDVPLVDGAASRQDLYAMRDESGLSRHDFFKSIVREGTDTVEIKGRVVK